MNLQKSFITLLFLLLIPATLLAVTPPVPFSPPERVIDLANIIEPTLETQLVSALRELETKTTAQIAVLTVSSLDGETIEAVSLHTFEQWKLGQKDKDNGLPLTVALKERKYRFETGYGLESVLPDSLLGSIGREKLVPFFKEGKYGEGIAAATKEVLAVFAKNYQTQIGAAEHISYHKPFSLKIFSVSSPTLTTPVSIMLFFLFLISSVILSLNGLHKIVPFIFMMSFLSMTSHAIAIFFLLFSIFIVIGVIKKWIDIDDLKDYMNFSSNSSNDSSSDNGFSGGGGESGGGGASGSW